MRCISHIRLKLCALLALLVFPISSYSSQSPEITAEEILGHVLSAFSEIEDYTVQLHAEFDMEDIQVPPMDVTVYFKKPDKIHLESTSFVMDSPWDTTDRLAMIRLAKYGGNEYESGSPQRMSTRWP